MLTPVSPKQSLVKSFEVTDLPVRTARFVPRKQWVVCGADDMMVRVYNYNPMDKVKQFEAHTDYIRCAAGQGCWRDARQGGLQRGITAPQGSDAVQAAAALGERMVRWHRRLLMHQPDACCQ